MGTEEISGDGKNHDEQETSQQVVSKEMTPPCKKKKSFKDRWKNPDYRRNVQRTIWLGASFWALGFGVGQRGPAFLDVQIITHTDVEQASFFFTASSVGYLVGSLVAGVIYDMLNKSLLFLLCVLGMGASLVILPWCSPYTAMIAIHFAFSLFGSAIDTAGNADLVRIWGTEGEMAMQFIHFAFAFGGVIGPLITEPFLTPNPEDDVDTSTTTITTPSWDNSTTLWNSSTASSVTDNSTALPVPLTTDVHFAFLISGGITFLIAIPLTVQLFSDRSRKRRQDQKDKKKNVKQPLPQALFLFALGVLCLFYFIYCSIEDSFSAFLSTFVVKQLHWSKSRGAQLSSVFWASFATGRFLSIFMVHLLNSVKLLFLSCVALLLSMLSFLLFSLHSVNVGIWVSTILTGMSMAAIFPTGFTWMEEELLRVTGRVASSILIAASTGTMVNPIVLGYLMQHLTPMWFTYLLFGQSALCLAGFLFLLALSRLYVQKRYVIHEERKTQEITVVSLSLDEHKAENSRI